MSAEKKKTLLIRKKKEIFAKRKQRYDFLYNKWIIIFSVKTIDICSYVRELSKASFFRKY